MVPLHESVLSHERVLLRAEPRRDDLQDPQDQQAGGDRRPRLNYDQTPKNQLRELMAYARRRRFRVTHKFVDRESGAKEDRKNLAPAHRLARKRQVDVVRVWKFDPSAGRSGRGQP